MPAIGRHPHISGNLNKQYMQFDTKNFRDININQIEPGNFVDKTKWNESIGKFKELKLFIDEMLRIVNLSQEIPTFLKTIATSYATTFISYLSQLTEEKTGQPAEIASQKEQVFRQFDSWYRDCIEKANIRSEQISFYEVFNTLKNLEKNNFEKELTEISNVKNKINSDKDSIDTILKELQKKTSNITMSDYAKIFGDESDSHKLMAWIWLGVGVLLSVLFLSILIFTDWYNKFPTEEIIGNNRTVKSNISNLLIKILIFTIQVFMKSFYFKQN